MVVADQNVPASPVALHAPDHSFAPILDRHACCPAAESVGSSIDWVGQHVMDCRICNLNFLPQTPGIMSSRRTAAASAPPSWLTLIRTARLNDVDPQAWLADVLARINDHKITDLAALLPWNWKLAQAKLAA